MPQSERGASLSGETSEQRAERIARAQSIMLSRLAEAQANRNSYDSQRNADNTPKCPLTSPCIGISYASVASVPRNAHNATPVVSMLDAAMAYARDGFHVVPLFEPNGAVCSCPQGAACTKPGKHPRTEHGFKAASIDEAQVREWWTRWPSANIGIACGPSSIAVIDVDTKGFRAWHTLEKNRAVLDGPRQRSGGERDGDSAFHHFFAHDHAANPLRNSKALGEGIDFIGDGGMIIVAPSLHASGRRYEWCANDRLDRKSLPLLPVDVRERLGMPRKPQRVIETPQSAILAPNSAMRPWHAALLAQPWTREHGTRAIVGRIIALAREHIRRNADNFERTYLADLQHVLDNSPDLWNPSKSGRRENPVEREIRTRSLLRCALAHPQSWEPLANLARYVERERRDVARGVVAVYEALCVYAMSEGIPHECISIDRARLGDLLGGIDRKQVARWIEAAQRCGVVFIVDRGRPRARGVCGIPATYALAIEGESIDVLQANAALRFERVRKRRVSRTEDEMGPDYSANAPRGWERVAWWLSNEAA